MSYLRQLLYSAIRNMVLSFPAPFLISRYLAENQTIKPVHTTTHMTTTHIHRDGDKI